MEDKKVEGEQAEEDKGSKKPKPLTRTTCSSA